MEQNTEAAMRNLVSIAVAIFIILVTLAACKNVTNNTRLFAILSPQDSALIEKFFGMEPGDKVHLRSESIGEDRYVVVMDESRQRAAVLNVAEELNRHKDQVRARGFFMQDQNGRWLADSREEFELEGGVWTLNRFLQVLQRERGHSRQLTWKGVAH